MTKKVALHNLGCKVNSYELEAVQQMFEREGYEIVEFAPGADIYVINTCTVTNIADRKSRQMLHRAKKLNPDALVVAMGCYAQVQGAALQKDPAIDIIVGNNQHTELPRMLRTFQKNEISIIDISADCEYEAISIDRTSSHTRAFIKVQDGCNQFCSYCIIPYARGRIRSRRIEDVVSEVQRIAEGGTKEIVCTGIHLCSYGADWKDGTELIDLLEALDRIDGIERIRLGSLEPASITDETAERMSRLTKLCPHFHLSMQSGCDNTLARMNRGYTSAEYQNICDTLRKHFDRPALTTDIIAGFPGETEEDFETTLKFTESVGFFETHIFPYSKREGTRAARMDGQVNEAVKKERSRRLRELDARQKEAYLTSCLGISQTVLLEELFHAPDGKDYWMGHTTRYQKVLIEKEDGNAGELISVCPNRILFGEYLAE